MDRLADKHDTKRMTDTKVTNKLTDKQDIKLPLSKAHEEVDPHTGHEEGS